MKIKYSANKNGSSVDINITVITLLHNSPLYIYQINFFLNKVFFYF